MKLIYAAGQTAEDLQGDLEANGRTYSWYQCVGTSMATPVVSGAIALWMQAFPWLTADQAVEAIQASSIRDADVEAGIPAKWGAGKFDAYAGLKYVLEVFNAGIDAVTAAGTIPSLIHGDGTIDEVFLAGADSLSIDLYSLSGAKVAHFDSPGCSGTFDAGHLMPGIYVVTVNGISATKIRIK